jgi:hypothetical protein
MIIHITINSFKADIDSDDSRVKAILDIIHSENNEVSTNPLELLILRQTWIAKELGKHKEAVLLLQLAQNLASEEYSKFSVPHFSENMGPREKCVDCGKLTSWLWNYKPHCKNNDRPECFDYIKERIPLDPTIQSLLENFVAENEIGIEFDKSEEDN